MAINQIFIVYCIECSPNCELCLQSQCLFCTEARYNDMCISVCPNGGTPNPNNGNECECPRNFGGNNCQGKCM